MSSARGCATGSNAFPSPWKIKKSSTNLQAVV
jgi:hypothetical protein